MLPTVSEPFLGLLSMIEQNEPSIVEETNTTTIYSLYIQQICNYSKNSNKENENSGNTSYMQQICNYWKK